MNVTPGRRISEPWSFRPCASAVLAACAALVVGAAVAAEPDGPGLAVKASATGLSVPRLIAARDDADPPPAPTTDKSRADALLADDNLELPTPATRIFGFDQVEAAYTLPQPGHYSKLLNRFELGAQGGFGDGLKWKISGRFDYDAIYDSHVYPPDVRHDQRVDVQFRETFVDYGVGDVDFRIGRQQIVWGEVVGLFVADVVSAKDLRESLVQDFDLLRIPQWAARAEYFKNDIHVEAIWIPFPTVDRIGKPGAAFYPYPPLVPGYGYLIRTEQRPPGDDGHQNVGLRASILRGGWDAAAFAYRSLDSTATFFREIVPGPAPTAVFTPRHEMITQYGTTVSKDFDSVLFKMESVYTVGRNYSVTSLADSDGVVSKNSIDYIVTAEVAPTDSSKINVAFFQRRFPDHDPTMVQRRIESGVTLFWSDKWSRFEPQLLLIHSVDRSDWLARPRLVWNVRRDWRAVAGFDIFGGRPDGLFGQYNKQDRAYVEIRRSF